jgi:hypothetical protein
MSSFIYRTIIMLFFSDIIIFILFSSPVRVRICATLSVLLSDTEARRS